MCFTQQMSKQQFCCCWQNS